VELEGTFFMGLLGLIATAELATVIRLAKVYVEVLAPYCQDKKVDEKSKTERPIN
jgi:hypothetical protein